MLKPIDKTGERLAELRKERKWTQKQVAEKLGVHEVSYNAWENGEIIKKNVIRDNKVPRANTEKTNRKAVNIGSKYIAALADEYGVSVDYILGRTDYRTINGADIARITGLSDHALKVLQLCGGDNPMMYHHARDVSRLLVDWDKNGANSLLSIITKYIQCKRGTVGRIVPDGGGLSPLGAVDMDISAALLYGIIEAVKEYKTNYENELNAARID